jgi:hypothetical protein
MIMFLLGAGFFMLAVSIAFVAVALLMANRDD